MLRLFAAAAALQTALGGSGDWTYDHQEDWAASCAEGLQQSPIRLENVPDDFNFSLDADNKIPASYSANAANIGYGQSMTVSPNGGAGMFGSVTYEGKEYRAIQFHVHFTSEYAVSAGADGTVTGFTSETGGLYDGVVHVVHQYLETPETRWDNDLLVIGRFFKAEGDVDSTFLNNLGWGSIGSDTFDGSEGNASMATPEDVDLSDFLGVQDNKVQETYYRYEGSLTTPPCTESVHWFVLTEPHIISNAQLALFKGEGFGHGTDSTARELSPVFTVNDVPQLYMNKLNIDRIQYDCAASLRDYNDGADGTGDVGQCLESDDEPGEGSEEGGDDSVEPDTSSSAMAAVSALAFLGLFF